MQFNEFTLTNFGAFRGASNALNLTPPSADRSVVLVGALNGGGKTTIIEAFQLVLYGKRSKFGRRAKKSSYDDYIRSIRNRYAPPKEPTCLELIFTVPEDGRSRQYRLKRSWLFDSRKPKEFFQVFVDGSPESDSVLSQTWQDEVERFLPRRLANLFFFDGERVETLADPESSAEVLRTAISSLLGLDVVDRCMSDLQVACDRVNKEAADEGEQAKLDKLEEQIKELRGAADLARQRVAHAYTVEIPSMRKRLDSAQAKFEAVGGNLFTKRTELENKKTEARTRQAGLQQNLVALAAGALPLRLVTSQLESIRKEATRRSEARSEDAKAVVIREFTDGFINWLDSQKVTKATRSAIESFIASKQAESSYNSEETPAPSLSDSDRQILAHLLDLHLATSKKQAEAQLVEYTETLSALKSAQTALSKVPDEAHVADLLKQITEEEENIRQAERLVENHEADIRRLELELDKLRKERSACYDKILLAKEAQRYTDYTKRSIATLSLFRESLLKQNIAKLESTVFSAFRLLMRKTTLVSGLKIDPVTVEISLVGPNGQAVDTAQLSAGERQLLAVSILWGLAQASKLDIPVVIDTPLGRLDGKHRENMINTYFPQASHQVILLSTDTEVDESAADLMKDSVGHKYLIDYCEQRTGSFIEKGYFGENKQS